MTAQERIKSLVQEWIAATKAKRPISLQELCRNCPELLPEVERRLKQVVAEARSRKKNLESTTSRPAEAEEGTQPQREPPVVYTPPMGDHYPTELGGYKLTKILGEGGMGRVYLADDTRLGRQIAIKVMKPEIAANPQYRERFLREAKATAALEHDHVITIFQVGEEKQIPFLVMPLLRGEALDSRLKRDGKQTLREAIRIAREMAEGLSAAHEGGLIHRDIKPANVWLDGVKGRVKILDFGLAKGGSDSGEVNLTQSGAVMGTPAYMSPEQARGLPVDHRADLFSLGGVLYQMITGKRPFSGSDTMSILTSLAMDTPTAPDQLEPLCPAELSRLTMQLLSKQPEDRPASAEEVADLLRFIEHSMNDTQRVSTRAPRSADEGESTELTSSQSSRTNRIRPLPPVSKSESKVTKPSPIKWIVLGVLLLLVGSGILISLLGKSSTPVASKQSVPEPEPKEKSPTPQENPPPKETTPPPKPAPVIQHALKFQGLGAHVVFPQLRYTEDQPTTLEMWLIHEPSEMRFFVLGKTRNLMIMRFPDGSYRISQLTGIEGKGMSATPLVEPGRWMHIAAVVDKNEFRIYFDGVPASNTQSGTGGYPQAPAWSSHLGNQIVRRKEGTGPGGIVRAARISQSARYPKGSTFTPPANLLADESTIATYDFTEGTGTILTDRSKNKNDGTVVGANWIKASEAGSSISAPPKPIEDPTSTDPDRAAAEYTVSLGGYVRVDGEEKNRVTARELPTGKFRLTAVFFHDTSRVTDAGLKIFSSCTHLTQLSFLRVPISDAGLSHFKRIENLTELHVRDCPKITATGLQLFRDCKQLKRLTVQNQPLGNGSLDSFKNCTQLTEIILRGTQFTASGIDQLDQLLPYTAIEWDGGRSTPKKKK